MFLQIWLSNTNAECRCVQKNTHGPWQTTTYEKGVCEWNDPEVTWVTSSAALYAPGCTMNESSITGRRGRLLWRYTMYVIHCCLLHTSNILSSIYKHLPQNGTIWTAEQSFTSLHTKIQHYDLPFQCYSDISSNRSHRSWSFVHIIDLHHSSQQSHCCKQHRFQSQRCEMGTNFPSVLKSTPWQIQ